MTDRVMEFAEMLRTLGPEAVAEVIRADLANGPAATGTTREDGIMRLYGDGPCIEVVDD